MASIIVDLSDDIKKLQSLKEEIQQIKNELKGINVKVDIDIAEGLEAQLKSLTTQYDALVQKMAEAEAKIAESTARINQSTETVIKAQEQMAKAAGSTQSATGGTSTTTNQAETASVQAQAKAYEELSAEIDAVMGTRTQNIRRMLEEQNAIRLIYEEIKRLTKSQSGNSALSAAQQNRLTQLNASLLQHKTALSELRQNLNNSFKLDNAAATSMNALSQSLSRMRMTYRELTEEERKSPFGQELLASIQQADAKIKELDATIGNHQRNVGNYTSGWNGLNMSIQQIGRELPSLAVGWNTFFLAISNNLPILADEIKRAKNEYNALKAAGKQATPVWKQVVSSLVSWQTALTVGITLLTLYGGEIVDFVKNLFEAKSITDEYKDAVKELNAEIKTEEAEVTRLFDALRQTKDGTAEYLRVKEEILDKYGKYLTGLDSEAASLRDVEAAYKAVTMAVRESARERALTGAMSKAQEDYGKTYSEYATKLREALLENIGEERTAEIFSELRKELDNTGKISDDLKKRIGDIFSGQFLYGKSNAWMKGLELNEQKLKDSYKAMDELFKRNEESANTISDINQEIQNTKNRINELNKEIAALRSGELKPTVGKTVKAAIDEKTKELQEAQQTLETLTGTRQNNESDKLIKSQQKASDLLIALRQQNQQSELSLMKEGADKKLTQIDTDYDAQKTEIEKKARELADANKKAGITGTNNNGLTIEQQKEIDRANQLNADNRIKQTEEIYKAEATAMRDYLKQYGTYQQQKLAIAEEYAEKIRQAQTEGERLTLGRQRDAALQQVEINAIQKNIDWGSVFGEFGTMFKAQLQPTIDQLRQIAQSDTFRQSSLEDQQLLYELIAKLEQSNTVWDGDIFRRVSDDMNAYQTAMQNYIAAQERERIATEKLTQAKEKLEEAERTGGDVETAQQQFDLAETMLSGAAGEVQKFGTQVQETTAALQSSSQQAINMFQDLESGLRGLASSSLSGIGQGIMRLDKLFNNSELTQNVGNALAEGFQSLFGENSKVTTTLAKALGSSGGALEIIGAILSILDLIAQEGLSGIASGLVDTVLGAVNSILDDILNLKIVQEVGKSLISGVGNILDTITFGGFSSWTSFGSNAEETAEKIAALTASNDALRTSIDGLKEEIQGTNGTSSINAYNEAIEAQKKYEENLRQILDANMRYSGAHHSNAYYWNLDSSSLAAINSLLGTNLANTWNDFSQLTADQMNEIRTHLPDVWSEMINQGKYGDRFAEAWEDYADQAGEIQELTDDLYESLTQISFDSLRDSFVDALMDMDAEAQDFADDFSEYMMRSLLNFAIGDQLDSKLQAWYESWAETMNEQGGELTEAQIEDYRKQWGAIVEEGLDIRDQIASMTGYTGDTSSSSSQQSGSYRAFGTEMTQDQGAEISGRLTALTESNYRLENEAVLQTATITELNTSVLELASAAHSTGDTSDEIRSILANSYLELQEINENTGSSARYLKDIKADIAAVKQNTGRI